MAKTVDLGLAKPDNPEIENNSDVAKLESALINDGNRGQAEEDSISPANPYAVLVDDNFHYMDEGERYCLGSFATLEDALGACKAIVDEYLTSVYRSGMRADELLSSYKMFGEDPFIVGSEKRVLFSAWDYAEQRCQVLCG
jgi:hypothetical protein